MKTKISIFSCIAIVVAILCSSATHFSSKKIKTLNNSYYDELGLFDENSLSFDGDIKIVFNLRDSVAARALLLKMDTMGWDDVELSRTEDYSKLVVYPRVSSGGCSLVDSKYINDTLYGLYQFHINEYSTQKNIRMILGKKAFASMEKFEKGFTSKGIDKKIISVMNFPGEKDFWRIKYSMLIPLKNQE